MSKIAPLTPVEAEAKALTRIPDFVIEAFNDLIVANLYQGRVVIKQEEAVQAILARMPKSDQAVKYVGPRNEATRDKDKDRATIFVSHWLEVEPVYREAGWKVRFDKPGYNEMHDGFYEFEKPK
jgi:hypothetical protein